MKLQYILHFQGYLGQKYRENFMQVYFHLGKGEKSGLCDKGIEKNHLPLILFQTMKYYKRKRYLILWSDEKSI